jgi:peptidoglycan hydrolase-like protein with peptidoglycan-binding domain
MKSRIFKNLTFLFLALLLFLVPLQSKADQVWQATSFNIDKNFDSTSRDQITAKLVKSTNSLYFYVESQWWDSQVQAKQNEILSGFDALSLEFSNKIYPILTSVFGKEWSPGVDGDEKITILFHAMNSNEGGYFRTADEYVKLQVPDSNEREMVYLSLDQIDNPKLKVILAHEFVHLITFNQKNKKFKVEEETWLNEARADYSSTILGYDDNYSGSNLQSRVKDFASNPSDSLTEWKGAKYDYASVSLFTHYLTDHYGIDTLIDSLKSGYTGIESLNYALGKLGSKEDFSQIFINWTIASIANDCSLGEKYCYLSNNLKALKITPFLNFIPIQGNVSLSVTDVTKNWTGNWLKFIGGNGNLRLSFSSLAGLDFKIPYIVEDIHGKQTIEFLQLDETQKGEIKVQDFSTNYKSIIIIPSLQSRISGFDGTESTYPFTYSVSMEGEQPTGDQATIQQLLDQIELLQAEIARLKSKNPDTQSATGCSMLERDLHYGLRSNSDVECLQRFLKLQGQDIYPEGYITGHFASLTRQAVIRFQEKYASDILTPIGLFEGTGYVGKLTRQKINLLMGATSNI